MCNISLATTQMLTTQLWNQHFSSMMFGSSLGSPRNIECTHLSQPIKTERLSLPFCDRQLLSSCYCYVTVVVDYVLGYRQIEGFGIRFRRGV